MYSCDACACKIAPMVAGYLFMHAVPAVAAHVLLSFDGGEVGMDLVNIYTDIAAVVTASFERMGDPMKASALAFMQVCSSGCGGGGAGRRATRLPLADFGVPCAIVCDDSAACARAAGVATQCKSRGGGAARNDGVAGDTSAGHVACRDREARRSHHGVAREPSSARVRGWAAPAPVQCPMLRVRASAGQGPRKRGV